MPIFLYGSKVLREVAAPVDIKNDDRSTIWLRL